MASEFRKKLMEFKKKTYTRTNQVFNVIVEESHRSVQLGSEITGAPGQPVDTGHLRSSWQVVWEGPLGPVGIGTNVSYARVIEDGERDGRALTLRSQVGGFHSVKLTIAGARKIARYAVFKVTGQRER